jgi:uroporphyrinogen-III synthase
VDTRLAKLGMMRTVVVTLSETALDGLDLALADADVTCSRHPMHTFVDAPWAALDSALRLLDGYKAVAVTSPRAAAALVARAGQRGRDQLADRQVWVSGARTAAALRDSGAVVHAPNQGRHGEGTALQLAAAMLAARVGSPVLFPCGDRRRDELVTRLGAAGVKVHPVVCYRTVLAPQADAAAAADLADVLLVGSPNVMALMASACAPDRRPELLAIGPNTALAAREHGWEPSAVAPAPVVAAIAESIRDLLAARRA